MSAAAAVRERQPLSYTVRRSPYFERTLAAGAIDFMVYNHTYMPIDYGRDPVVEYEAMTQGVTLWDVGAERQAAAARPRRAELRRLPQPARPARPRGRPLPLHAGLRPARRRSWPTASCCGRSRTPSGTRTRDADISLWAYGLALARGARVEVRGGRRRAAAAPGPARRAPCSSRSTTATSAALRRFDCAAVDVAGVPCVVSNTGWSKEAGYEIYPLGSERCLELWDAHRGEPASRTGCSSPARTSRARSSRASPTRSTTINSGMTALEAGLGPMLAPRRRRRSWAARRCSTSGRAAPRRRTIGLVGRRRAVPVARGLLAGARRRRRRRSASRAGPSSPTRSSRTSRSRSSMPPSATPTSSCGAPDGDRAARVHAIPFV